MYVLTGFIQGIPKEMEESAVIDGCSIYAVFVRIIVPMLKPALAAIAIFTFLESWNELMLAITFISYVRCRTITVGLNNMIGQYVSQWGR
jgi:raffinose/stachyose/melibiose transport system permease protein